MTTGAYQQGAASLLITLVLVMTTSLITLAVARTQLDEQRIAGNDSRHTRLFLHAEAGVAQGLEQLSRRFDSMDWRPGTGSNEFINHTGIDSGRPDIINELVFSYTADADRYIRIQSVARRDDGSALQVSINQQVRLLSILTPGAEKMPPLVLNGCLASLPAGLDIRPLNADTRRAGDAAWLNRALPCPALESADLHNGALAGKNMQDDLWQRIFSVSREEFLALAESEQALPPHLRRYRVVQETATGMRWDRSLGTADLPVALYFPALAGCPEFGPGTRIHGVIFIDAGCTRPVATYNFTVFGTLVVNGNLDIGNTGIALNHIQVADPQLTRLDFPVLRAVRIPGSWRDF
ncbi:MAG TPA: hypothetical protein ENJ80_04405 [Gammaproteobacteria bacterium]|nr:hypothetical protein [Gammaproteobacteria bacterium]